MSPNVRQHIVWLCLPGSSQYVPCGLLDWRGTHARFAYGRRYVQRPDAISISPEWPLSRGSDQWLEPLHSDEPFPSVIGDVAPGRWAEYVFRKLNLSNPTALDLLLQAGSARVGALRFSQTPDQPPADDLGKVLPLSRLGYVMEAARAIEAKAEVPEKYRLAFQHGPSIGGRRPKADFVDGEGRLWIAKFSSLVDVLDNQPLIEAFGLEMARRCGIDVPPFRIEWVDGRAILLIERFDGLPNGGRRHVLSAKTLLQVPERSMDLEASYPAVGAALLRLADQAETAARWFDRLIFNIAIGNTDDHALNHLFFWDGARLALAPAFDLEPQGERQGGQQQMQVGTRGAEASIENALSMCVDYGLRPDAARKRTAKIVQRIVKDHRALYDTLGLSNAARVWLDSGLRLAS